jgi:23S rRNA pseudouridine2605 synthase
VASEQPLRQIGLARALSKLGYCSRSLAAELVRAGRVHLNGVVRRDPETPVHLGKDRIAIDGRTIKAKEKFYLMMNKPRGLVTTASDEKGRETVYSILKKSVLTTGNNDALGEMSAWVAPVGRLDKASEGLLLLTNDSEWGARVVAPETHLPKTYHVQIASLADEKFLRSMTAGVNVEEKVDAKSGAKTHAKTGEALRARHVRLLRSGEKNCWLEVVLDEGKNRQIRRMLQALGIEVLRLVRVSIGPLELGKLAKGECRALTADEKQILDRAMQAKSS